MPDHIYLGKMSINLDMSDLWDQDERIRRFLGHNADLRQWLRDNLETFEESRIYTMTEPHRTYDEISFYLRLGNTSDSMLWKLRPDDVVATTE